jgi:hypothetical protein
MASRKKTQPPRPTLTGEDKHMACEHEKELEFLVSMSLSRRSSLAQAQARAERAAELKEECAATCGRQPSRG